MPAVFICIKFVYADKEYDNILNNIIRIWLEYNNILIYLIISVLNSLSVINSYITFYWHRIRMCILYIFYWNGTLTLYCRTCKGNLALHGLVHTRIIPVQGDDVLWLWKGYTVLTGWYLFKASVVQTHYTHPHLLNTEPSSGNWTN